MIFSFFFAELKTRKTSELSGDHSRRFFQRAIQQTSLGWPTNCAYDNSSRLCKWIFNCYTCATSYKLHARLLHIASFSSSSSRSAFSFCLFLDERVSRFDPEGAFERQRRLALKTHYDNINTESISMAPAHFDSILSRWDLGRGD